MKSKNLVSLSVALVFSALSITGLLIYFGFKAHAVDHIHAWFGVLFVGAAVFHIVNNWSSLTAYTKNRRTGGVRREFMVPTLVAVVFAAGIGFDVPPFSALANMGKPVLGWTRPKKEAGPEKVSFEQAATNQAGSGTPLTLMVQRSQSASEPVMAVWVEDSARVFVENLFVPAQMAVKPTGDKQAKATLTAFTPATLPVWQAKATDQKANYDKATPTDPFILKTKTAAKGTYHVMLAVLANGKTEQYEATVSAQKGDIYRLRSAGGQLLDRGIVVLE